jgi:hypothetical protein
MIIYTYISILLCDLRKTGTGNVHILLLKIREFRENWVKESRKFLAGVNKLHWHFNSKNVAFPIKYRKITEQSIIQGNDYY